MKVELRIRRFNPEKDSIPWWGDYTVEDVNPNDSVLDVLHRVKWGAGWHAVPAPLLRPRRLRL